LYPVPIKNPTKDPRAERKAFSPVDLLIIYSHRNAPTNGKIIIPNGGKKNIPAIIPRVEPVTPACVPQYFLVHQIGRK
jgi:hypothetical protein